MQADGCCRDWRERQTSRAPRMLVLAIHVPINVAARLWRQQRQRRCSLGLRHAAGLRAPHTSPPPSNAISIFSQHRPGPADACTARRMKCDLASDCGRRGDVTPSRSVRAEAEQVRQGENERALAEKWQGGRQTCVRPVTALACS